MTRSSRKVPRQLDNRNGIRNGLGNRLRGVKGKSRGQRNKRARNVRWQLDVEDMNDVTGVRSRDAGFPKRLEVDECKAGTRTVSSPNSRTWVKTCEPDPLPVPPHLDGPDQSLSEYEILFERLFARIRMGIISDVQVQTLEQRKHLGLELRDGLLWKMVDKGIRLYVPDTDGLRGDILYWHHDVPWCAHLGVTKTLELVKRQFWWPKMSADIGKYVESCYKCQANKPDRRNRTIPLTPLVPPSACWRTVGVDMIVDLPVSIEMEYNAIIVFMCHLSKMVRIIPTHTTLDAKGLAQLFIREIFPHYGMPTEIISDRGTQWNNEFFQALCDEIGIRLKMSTDYHPQTNGA